MKRTKKYGGACEILTITHANQEELYQELQRLGWFWDSKQQSWVRDDRVADPPTKLVRIRVWAVAGKVGAVADAAIEALQPYDLVLQERSDPYPCRPPKQLESRIYLTFLDQGED